MLGALALRLANLKEELELLRGIFVLFLLDAAVDHAVERHQEGFITRCSALI